MERGTIPNKLRSPDGASIVLALLVLLAAAMFSMAILTGSVNAAQAARGQYETEQSYLCVSAAARLVHQSIAAETGGGDTTDSGSTDSGSTDSGTPDSETVYKREASIHHYDADGGAEGQWPRSGTLRTFLTDNGFAPKDGGVKTTLYRPEQAGTLSIRELLSYLYERFDAAEKEQSCTLTITLPLPLTDEKKRLVEAVLTMRPSVSTKEPYSLTVDLTSAGGTESQKYAPYKMRLEYACTVVSEDTERYDAQYEEDEDGTPVLDYWETVKITTTTLTWDLNKVGRGTWNE